MPDFRKRPTRWRPMMLGGQVLYDPEQPISDAERLLRIKRALRNVGWKSEGEDRTIPAGPGVARPPTLPGRIVSGEILPARALGRPGAAASADPSPAWPRH